MTFGETRLVDKTPTESDPDNLALALARWLEAADAYPKDRPRGLLALAEARRRLGLTLRAAPKGGRPSGGRD